jgi:hypothetical protein
MRRRFFLCGLIAIFFGCGPKDDYVEYLPPPPSSKPAPPATDALILDRTVPAGTLAARIEGFLQAELANNLQVRPSATKETARELGKEQLHSMLIKGTIDSAEERALSKDARMWREVFALDLVIIGELKGSEYSQILVLYAFDFTVKERIYRREIVLGIDKTNSDEELARLAKEQLKKILRRRAEYLPSNSAIHSFK